MLQEKLGPIQAPGGRFLPSNLCALTLVSVEERFSKLKASAVPLAPFLALQLCDCVEPDVFQGLLDKGKKEAMDVLCHEVGGTPRRWTRI